MSVVVVATLSVKPESVGTVRDILTAAVEEVHDEPGCELYSLHQTGETFVFIEQWADADALKTHSAAPAVAKLFAAAGEHLVGQPDIKMLQPIPAGDFSKGQLRP
ncbi:putative quinol monooxygenase [Mycobacterium lacus]|uniref:Antibiotic biosynthesis monooxygenase n=1 Tax=Mycobacterium lacus TaxID=169765 RepID=A0A1X1YL30_9MYCO|nr:putative quinol monooxygenase [Mycobacterium lacus]MCV7123079.1 antibiotic biosynthesis monooxygenase [Mycobacterium lacus]ORW11762.1 antibiotic biosynthesis monooxygenase [Mycobacterium lacus]BBX97385.1 antibiotic biosynthesis monooxygenase [Mycobacterium lacus]